MMLTVRQLLYLALFAMTTYLAHAFYVPGVAPQDFHEGDLVEVKVSDLIHNT